MSDTDFVQITATTDHATGQALLYALTRAGYVWQRQTREPVSQKIISKPCGHGGR